MEKYFRKSNDVRAKKYFIYDSDCSFIRATNSDNDIETLEEIYKKEAPVTAFFEYQELSNGFVKKIKSLDLTDNQREHFSKNIN